MHSIEMHFIEIKHFSKGELWLVWCPSVISHISTHLCQR